VKGKTAFSAAPPNSVGGSKLVTTYRDTILGPLPPATIRNWLPTVVGPAVVFFYGYDAARPARQVRIEVNQVGEDALDWPIDRLLFDLSDPSNSPDMGPRAWNTGLSVVRSQHV
jgi:hypothetical protein